MAKVKLPDALARRHLLEGKLDAGKSRGYGEAYLEAGREIEAIDFLARGDATDALSQLQNVAVERGDVFLMRMATAALGTDPGAEVWTQLASAADAAGRERDAEAARRLATVES